MFDAVFSFSSLEHSGLGRQGLKSQEITTCIKSPYLRYGDPLNPWGDMMSVAEAWCVSTPSAHLALAVPTSVSTGRDWIAYNAHRIYGPLMYPYLVVTLQPIICYNRIFRSLTGSTSGQTLVSTVLYCTVLYCTVLYCTVLYCSVLFCSVLYCNWWWLVCYKVTSARPVLPVTAVTRRGKYYRYSVGVGDNREFSQDQSQENNSTQTGDGIESSI